MTKREIEKMVREIKALAQQVGMIFVPDPEKLKAFRSHTPDGLCHDPDVPDFDPSPVPEHYPGFEPSHQQGLEKRTMGPCEDCNQYHATEVPCDGYKCLRCGEVTDDNSERDGCRDPDCPCN